MKYKIRQIILYFLYVALFILISCEIFLSYMYPVSREYSIWPPHLYEIFEPSDETTPGVSGKGRFRINSLGLRSDEPPNDDRKIFYVMGGSTVIDLYLDQDRAWVQQLQTKSSLLDVPTWVGNLGRSSMATMHNLLMFKHLIPNLPKPKIVINLVGVNDLQLALKSSYLRDMTEEMHMSWIFSRQPAKSFWDNLAIVRFHHRIVDWRMKSKLGPVQTNKGNGFIEWKKCRAEAKPEDIVNHLPDLSNAIQEYRQNLNVLVDNANAIKATTIFLTQPTTWSDRMGPEELSQLLAGGVGPNSEWCKVKKYYSPAALSLGMEKFNSTLLSVCKERNLFCIDLANKVPKKAKYFYDEMHLSDAGADLVSDIVSKEIFEYKKNNGTLFLK